MPLSPYACANCGFWQRHFAPPPDCPVCTDVRNDLPEDGWSFLAPPEVNARLSGRWRQLTDDLYAFGTAPRFGLDGTGWLIVRPEGNVAFEAAPWYTEPMRAEIARLGGIAVLAASHPHGYGALWQLQDAFEPPVVAIQREDLNFTKALRVNTPFEDRLDLGAGLTLHHVGGHYDGQAVLHDARRGLLFAGDMFKIDQDARGASRAMSMHKAFHKRIPLTHREIARYREVVASLDFTAVLTPFEYAPDIDTRRALAVLDAALAGPLSVDPYPLPG